MAQTLSAKIRVLLQATLEDTKGLATVPANLNRADLIDFASGVGLNQANRIYTAAVNIAAAGTLELDLAGVLTDVFGAVITFARIKAIYVQAAVANVNNVVVGGAAATPFIGPFADATDKIHARPGGMILLVAPDATGWPVGAGASDKLLFENSGGGTAVDFNLVIVGANA